MTRTHSFNGKAETAHNHRWLAGAKKARLFMSGTRTRRQHSAARRNRKEGSREDVPKGDVEKRNRVSKDCEGT